MGGGKISFFIMNWLPKLLRESPNDHLGLTADSGVSTVLFAVTGQFWTPSPQASAAELGLCSRAETAGKGRLEKAVSPVPANQIRVLWIIWEVQMTSSETITASFHETQYHFSCQSVLNTSFFKENLSCGVMETCRVLQQFSYTFCYTMNFSNCNLCLSMQL